MKNQDNKLIIDKGLNKLFIFVDGKYEPLRIRTVYQMERYRVWVEETDKPADPGVEKAPEEKRNSADAMNQSQEMYLTWCGIALNPEPNKEKWPRERILEKFDLDQIELIARIWMDRFLVPRIEQDPRLVP